MFKKLIALTGIALLSLNTAQAQINADPGQTVTGTLPGFAGHYLSFNPDTCAVSWNGRYPSEPGCPYEWQYVDPVCLNDCKYRWRVNINMAKIRVGEYCQALKDKAAAEVALAAAEATEQQKMTQLTALREAMRNTSESIRYYESLYEQVQAAYDQYFWDCVLSLGFDTEACDLQNRMANLLVEIEDNIATFVFALSTQESAYAIAYDEWRQADIDVWSAQRALTSAGRKANAALRNLNTRIRAGMDEWSDCTRDCECLESDH